MATISTLIIMKKHFKHVKMNHHRASHVQTIIPKKVKNPKLVKSDTREIFNSSFPVA
jgi:hypothetical protein